MVGFKHACGHYANIPTQEDTVSGKILHLAKPSNQAHLTPLDSCTIMADAFVDSREKKVNMFAELDGYCPEK